MERIVRLQAVLILAGIPVFAADVCNPADLQGSYGFQLSGTTTISGTAKPLASLGRIVFDGTGGLTGYSSAVFAGFLLGNPVTGNYEARTDCSVTFRLQDDSGAFQNFGGTLSPDASRVQFRQTDPGGAERGVMQKAPSTCSSKDIQKQYSFTLSGDTTPMGAGAVARTISAQGDITVDEGGVLKLAITSQRREQSPAEGTLQIESDCTVRLELWIPAPDGAAAEPMTLRGILVNSGKGILAIQTDPGAMVAARFTAR